MRVPVLLLVLFFPFNAWGQTVCGPQDYDSEDAPNFECPSPNELETSPDLHAPNAIKAQEGVDITPPWDGALVHRDRLIEIGLKLQAIRRLRWTDRLKLAERYRIDLEHERETARIRQKLIEAQTEQQRQRAVAAERRATSASAWYRSWWFGLTCGLVISGVLIALAAYVVTVI